MISPFSLSHEWQVNWTIVPSRYAGIEYAQVEKNERQMLESITAIGVIGGRQISRLFYPNKKKRDRQKILKKLCQQRKLVRHEIIKNTKSIPLFTVGPAVKKLFAIEMNYWVTYTIEDILKNLLFFQLYIAFKEYIPHARVRPAPSPFTGAIQTKEDIYYVYVIRGDITDLLTMLKWSTPSYKIVVITEHLDHLALLNPFADKLKIRVTTDLDLYSSNFEEMFYAWFDNEWIKIIPRKDPMEEAVPTV